MQFFWLLHIRGQMGSFQKTWNGGKLYKLSGRKEGSMVEPQQLSEPERPWVSLMISLPSQTETHWMIMLQIGQETLFPSIPLHHNYRTPSTQPSITLLLLSLPSILLNLLLSIFLHSTIHPSSSSPSLYIYLPTARLSHNSTHLEPWHTERLWSNLMMLFSNTGI